ncbi:ABC transporter substrate-binding protein [Breznakiella homolactica]|uniref:Extracellular solute-binding protein n=1 Tax=Breznakiella homolactica TaxID=2798577 RepID=A0A7T7XNI1_9SPIR|nr:extracellular solute-binding protein [Breznakiella homolactica]QQO09615.1 extracellular solute-binding protein [Breznakiella homolactica]
MRKFTVLMVLLFSAAVLCFAGGGGDKGGQAGGAGNRASDTIEWWDHFMPIAPLHQQIWDAYTAQTGIKVNYTQYDPAKQSEALLLAFRSNQSPDVFSMTFPQNTVPSMQKEGWFSPMALELKDLPDYVTVNLFEGFTVFGGKVYSFPTMNVLNHNVATWYHKKPVADAGYRTMPQSFAEIRDLAKKVTQQSGGKMYGVVLPISFTTRMNDSIKDWANASGGAREVDWKTGEYQFASPAYFEVFEFLTGLKDDGSVHPVSVNLDMRAARERWAAGEAAILFDGSWNVGVVKSNFPAILDQMGVAEPARKNDRIPYTVYRMPPGGTFFISSNSGNVQAATDILKELTSDEYYIQLANRMDQPPLKLSAVKQADVHSTYVEVIDIFGRTMGFEPHPILKNPDTAQVYAEMREVHPNPAEILQGYYSGAIKDWKAELVKYNDAMTRERDRAIKKIQDQGVKVSIDDWKFPNWQYGMNYTSDKY